MTIFGKRAGAGMSSTFCFATGCAVFVTSRAGTLTAGKLGRPFTHMLSSPLKSSITPVKLLPLPNVSTKRGSSKLKFVGFMVTVSPTDNTSRAAKFSLRVCSCVARVFMSSAVFVSTAATSLLGLSYLASISRPCSSDMGVLEKAELACMKRFTNSSVNALGCATSPVGD